MQQDILFIGVLFPAIPLLMVNFGNRYTVLANLIRHLHDEVICHNISPQDAKRFLRQIGRLRDRLRLIGIIQSCAVISFVLALWRNDGHLFRRTSDRQRDVSRVDPADDGINAAVDPRDTDRQPRA